jgi:methyl-accepting chemotaxis protein
MSKTIVTSALAGGAVEEVCTSLVATLERGLGGQAPALVLVFCSTKQPLADVTGRLQARFGDAIVLGATTAGEFTESRDTKGAVAAVAIAGDLRIAAGIGVGLAASPEAAIGEAVRGMPRQMHGFPCSTAIMLLDPLSARSEEACLVAGSLLGSGVRLAGGAAGDDLAMKSTEVALGARAASDAVVIATIFSKSPLGVGVAHGHEPISPPLRVTRADGATLHEIEGRPAWSVWVENTRALAATRGIDVDALAGSDVGAFLLRYEAGLAAGKGFKIRAPLVRNDDGSILFACEVPQGSVIRITESIPERQIGSAREAARRARAQLTSEPAGAVVFDCICRNLILGANFSQAANAISDELGGVPLAGFETYGEIALDVGDMSGFHNTTSVVLAFPSM